MSRPDGAPPSRPRVWVNCAVSMDGRLAFAEGARARISGPEDLVRVHRLRAASDAILVGVGTVVRDDPSLRLREELLDERPKAPPIRVVVDGSGRTPPTAKILDTSQPTIVATTETNRRNYPAHVRVVRSGQGSVDLRGLFRALRELGIQRLLVEGGSHILASVAREQLFDRWTIYYGPFLIGGSSAPPMVSGTESVGPADLVHLNLEEISRLGEGLLATLGPQLPVGGGDRPPLEEWSGL